LSKDRISGAWVGWLLDAAQALEAFLFRQAPRFAANAWSEAKRVSTKSIDKTLLRSEVVLSM
jgi:hypothetical protein